MTKKETNTYVQVIPLAVQPTGGKKVERKKNPIFACTVDKKKKIVNTNKIQNQASPKLRRILNLPHPNNQNEKRWEEMEDRKVLMGSPLQKH